MKNLKRISCILLFTILPFIDFYGQGQVDKVVGEITNYLNQFSQEKVTNINVYIKSFSATGDSIVIKCNDAFSYIPFRENNVKEIYTRVRTLLPNKYKHHRLIIKTDNQPIEDLIPIAFQHSSNAKTFTNKSKQPPLVINLSKQYLPYKGLLDKHIALWQSHGYYYEPKLARWEWQRARIFQTVEDLYTQSYVLPFLVPMLEDAGAITLLPRERDTQEIEIIIDNDSNKQKEENQYQEIDGTYAWVKGENEGFAHLKSEYKNFENPFKEGTYKEVRTIKKGKESRIEWHPIFKKEGKYAVYIAYKTVENSCDDARYTVEHKGGTTSFKVNQQMGGGTWIYLGHFYFDKGEDSGKITLTNRSDSNDKIVTADAVKIGGGYGNIARTVSPQGITENIKSSAPKTVTKVSKNETLHYPYETSGYPRFCEAARYWLQWAGVPDSIYSESNGINDYTDDYKARGRWVNYLTGGSENNPKEKGLNIPIDLAFAFHSDAGTTYGDTIIGTLGIFEAHSNDGKFENGVSRYRSRDLTDLIQSSIVNDIRKLYGNNWSRRGMWNRSYYEARVPKVPTMLLELLSHQNFADMQFGLDPRFRFTVSRAIYKGILRYIASQYKEDYVVQPLPVDHLKLELVKGNKIELSWKAVEDILEPTAQPERYIVYKRLGDGAFDQGTIVKSTSFSDVIPSDIVCSYKVAAINKGGKSFDSEILSIGKSSQQKGVVLVINGFNRISAPADFTSEEDSLAGFLDHFDHGVPYLEDISYIGSQKEFRRKIPWMDDDASGFGDSYGNFETQVVKGNTFDYPAIHGKAILNSGYSFASASDEAVEENMVKVNGYPSIDLILGKEYQSKMGTNKKRNSLAFKTFSNKMQNIITNYCRKGGSIFVSGAYVGTDLWDNPLAEPQQKDKTFARTILKYKWRANRAAQTDKIKSVYSPLLPTTGEYRYYNKLNNKSYVVEAPDAIEPADEKAYTIFRYSENNLSAGIAYRGRYATCILGFPFESIRSDKERDRLMKSILFFLNKEK